MCYAWKTIDSAPRDRVILTIYGCARYSDNDYDENHHGFYLCDASGNIPYCAEDGERPYMLFPKYWMQLLDGMG